MFVHVIAIGRLLKEKKKNPQNIPCIQPTSKVTWFEISGKYFSFAVVGGGKIYCFVKESLGIISSYLPRIANRFGRDVIGNNLCVTNNESFKQGLCLVFFLYNVLSFTVKVDEAIRHIRTYMWIVV